MERNWHTKAILVATALGLGNTSDVEAKPKHPPGLWEQIVRERNDLPSGSKQRRKLLDIAERLDILNERNENPTTVIDTCIDKNTVCLQEIYPKLETAIKDKKTYQDCDPGKLLCRYNSLFANGSPNEAIQVANLRATCAKKVSRCIKSHKGKR